MKLTRKMQMKTRNTTPPKSKKPKIIDKVFNPQIKKVGIHQYSSGHSVSIFEVSDYRALNQLIGYAKFINTEYGDVYYRGEVRLHDTLLPSISRGKSQDRFAKDLNSAINKALADEKFIKTAKLSGFKGNKNPSLVMEAMLQHYGYSTHFIDVVDNHWIALWFGLNKFVRIKNLKEYCFYEERKVNPIELINAKPDAKDDIYQYMILVAVDNNAAPVERGIYIGNDMITIDLRSSLPSMFLRPHAQHGLAIKRNRHETHASFDISENVIAIIRLRIDKVATWIGSGSLLSNENLFPSPAFDYGYEVLLLREDLFNNGCQKIAEYI